MSPEEILLREGRARDARRGLEPVWQEAYDHVLARMPGHGGETLYDATAADAAEQLAASLIAELCPPWSRWFGLAPARRADEAGPDLARPLDDAAETLQAHLDRSNFALELHQCFLDLVVAGTGVLAVEEAPIGDVSALTFHAVPLREAVLEEGPAGRLETIYRTLRLTAEETARRFPFADALPGTAEPDRRFRIVECVTPDASGGVAYAAVLDAEGEGPPARLAAARLADSPFIAFRWLKAPGETYGRGPVVKALPDIRTANKVVELILKNASIAATGIWLAEDDGVLNPATIRLVPGAIIPKAPGSKGLVPLQPAGSFDVSQLVLEDLRRRIRAALLADRIAPQQGRMTATEVIERSAETARLLGATYGRLQSELLSPLIGRCLRLLRRRGEIPAELPDGTDLRLVYQSPLARVQGRADAANTMLFLQAAASLGPEAAGRVDVEAATRFLARTLGAPAEILKPAPTPAEE
jgi:hypothetical protein